MVKSLFDEFREIVKYKKRIKGANLAALGFNPKENPQLEELFGLLEDKEIEIRIDPLFAQYSLHTTLISEERAKRPIVVKPVSEKTFLGNTKEDCDFCKPRVYLETAVPKIHYGEQQFVTAPNLFPYISPHFVTIFTNEHKPNLEDLTRSDVATYLSTGREIAYQLREDGQDGMWDFINWGATAGGSQPHPHAQRGGLYRLMRTLMDKEAEALEKRKEGLEGKDPFEVYMELARKGQLSIYEDDDVFVFAPYAPRFTDQIDILTKKKDKIVSNYLEIGDGMIDSLSDVMVDTLRKLRTERGVSDLNVETHQARFCGSSDYRMHWHIYPRKSLIAGMELNDIYIVSAYPEDTAKTLYSNVRNTKILKEESFVYDPCDQCVERLTGVAGEPCVGCSYKK